jgi:hypothetical protein
MRKGVLDVNNSAKLYISRREESHREERIDKRGLLNLDCI